MRAESGGGGLWGNAMQEMLLLTTSFESETPIFIKSIGNKRTELFKYMSFEVKAEREGG